MDYARFSAFLDHIITLAERDDLREPAITLLALLLNRRYSTGKLRRRSVLQMVSSALDSIFRSIPMISENESALSCCRIDFDCRHTLRGPGKGEKVLVADAGLFLLKVMIIRPTGLGRLQARLEAVHLFRPARSALSWVWVWSRHKGRAYRRFRFFGRLSRFRHGRS